MLSSLHRLAALAPSATALRMLVHGGSLNATREGIWLVSLHDFPAALTHAMALPGDA
jgi:hypothetical protein